MAITINSVRCPECGADLPIEEGRSQLFCSYCGTKVIVTNENEYIYRHIDEAEIRKAETDQMIELKKLELIEKKRESAKRIKLLKIIISIGLGIFMLFSFGIGFSPGGNSSLALTGELAGIVIMFIWTIHKEDDTDYLLDGKIKVPLSINDFQLKNYTAIEAMLRSTGFTNIRCIPLGDLSFGLLQKPNTVASITIDGINVTRGGDRFLPHSEVLISYHSIARRR